MLPPPPSRRLLLPLVLALLAVAAPLECFAQTGGTDIFRIGGHQELGGTDEGSAFTQLYGPTFKDYLGRALPGLSFEIVPLNKTNVYDAVAREEVDFLFTDPATFVCLSSEFAATFLATRSNLMLRYEANYIASAIVTRAERRDITSFADVAGTRVGTASYRTVEDMVRIGSLGGSLARSSFKN